MSTLVVLPDLKIHWVHWSLFWLRVATVSNYDVDGPITGPCWPYLYDTALHMRELFCGLLSQKRNRMIEILGMYDH